MKVIFEVNCSGYDDEICKVMRYLEDNGFHVTRMSKITWEQEVKEINKRLDKLEKKKCV